MSVQKWDDILSDPHQKAYILQLPATTVVGVIVLKIPPEEEYAKFGVFAISKIHQGKKFGEILIDHVEQIARTLKKKSMRIEVFAFARHLEIYYQKRGYVYTGKKNSFFHAECIKPEFKDKNSRYLKELEKKL